MTDYREQLIDADLQEVLGGKHPPDLRHAALARLRARRAFPWRRLAQAAGIALVLGLIGWVVMRPGTQPAWRAAQGTQYAMTPQGIELKSGWLLIGPGSPVVDVAGTRVEAVSGRAVASTAYVDGMELRTPDVAAGLGLTPEETALWMNLPRDHVITSGALTLILLSGQAKVDGLAVVAGDPPPEGLKPPRSMDVTIQSEEAPPAPAPQPGDLDGLKELLKQVRSAEVRAMDEQQRWGGWLELSAAQIAAARRALEDGILARSARPAGWKHLNQVLLTLEDGREVDVAMYTFGDLCNVRVPGQAGWTEYVTTPGLKTAFELWFESAVKVERAPVLSNVGMARMLARAREVRYEIVAPNEESTRGIVSDRKTVSALAGKIWPNEHTAARTYESTRDVFKLELDMPGGDTLRVNIDAKGAVLLAFDGDSRGHFRGARIGLLAEVNSLLRGLLHPLPVLIQQWSGPRSRVTEPRCEIITTPEGWKKAWADHEPTAALPAVDFDRELVVAIFRGSGQNSRGFFVHEMLGDDAGGTILRVDERHYQTFTEDRRVGVDRVTPYGIFVLTRTDYAITVEENVQNIIGKPPIWLPRATLAAKPTSPPVARSWRASRNWHGTGGPGEAGVQLARSAEEWRDMWGKATQHRGETPALPESIDWQRQCAVVVTAGVSQGNTRHTLNHHGQNADRTVLRLALLESGTPRGVEPVVRPIYDIWIIPRPANRLVIETQAPKPAYGVSRWLEEHSFDP